MLLAHREGNEFRVLTPANLPAIDAALTDMASAHAAVRASLVGAADRCEQALPPPAAAHVVRLRRRYGLDLRSDQAGSEG